MKLEIKHIAPYLPYGLKMTKEDWGKTGILVPWIMTLEKGLQIELDYAIKTQAKPILRPLSDLTKDIEHDGEKFVPIKWFELNLNKTISFYNPINQDLDLQIDIETENYSQTIDLFDGYKTVQKLLEWHFDVFGLIEKGLAINLNDIK